MKYLFAPIVFSLLFISCQKSKFEREFECETPSIYTQTKTYKDVLDHFEVDVPISWKTELYYDEYNQHFIQPTQPKHLGKLLFWIWPGDKAN